MNISKFMAGQINKGQIVDRPQKNIWMSFTFIGMSPG